jgi:tetratricopeptide (TPR) repeat protein
MPSDLPEIDHLWNYDDPAASEARFREQLAAAEPGSAAAVQLLTQIARSQGLQRQFDAAHATLDEAEQRLTDTLPTVRARYLLERGRVFNSSGHQDQAKPFFLRAWELAAAQGDDYYAVDAAHMLGIVEPPAEAVAWNLKAIAYAEQSSQPRARGWLGSLYNNLGWTLHDQGDYTQALALFEKGVVFRAAKAAESPKPWRIARWTVARCLRSLGRPAEALSQQQALLAEYAAAGQASDGYVQEEIGENLLLLGRPAEARPFFADAYAALSQDPWLVEGEPERLARMQALGEGRPA